MPRIAVHTFGCKINQYESRAMGESLASRGHDVVDEGDAAEVHVINSCTVTGPSDAQCRQLIRRIVRANPRARVVVTGCYAQRDPEALARIPGVSLVLGHAEKAAAADHLHALLDDATTPASPRPRTSPVEMFRYFDETPISSFGPRTRATVKVQDGCDKSCGFCVIPAVRGASRSRPAAAVLEEVRRLVDGGYLEIVLAGIHLGSWRGEERHERLDSLVERILAVPGLRRLRLSSLEPQQLTDRLLALSASPNLMPFFHLPLQAGDDGVLRRMRRGYNTRQFAERVERLVTMRPDVGIGSDILVGYPGEDAAAFERGLAFIESIPFSHFHVFTYSPRPGTEAASLTEQVGAPEKRDRGARMRALGEAKAAAFRSRFVRHSAEVLVESKQTPEGRLTGYTGNYIRTELPSRPDLVNRIVPVTLHAGERAMLAIPEAA